MTHTVLLIDGEPLTEHVYSRALRLAGHAVMLAPDTCEALESLEDDMPDAIVIPASKLDCIEDSRALRALLLGTDIPVILVGQTVASARLVHEGNVLFARSGDATEVVGIVREALGARVLAA